MSDTPWTPGPWEVMDGVTVWAGDEDTGHYIVPPNDMRWEDSTKADARLIAAAPEMAELLQGLYDAGTDSVTASKLFDQAYHLLSRIRGEA